MQNIISCKSGASLVGHDQSGYVRPWGPSWMQLTYSYYVHLTNAVACWEVPLSTFWYVNEMTVMILCCLVQVWAEDTKSSRYSPQDKQNQLNTAPCNTKDCWHNSRPCTVHYTHRTVHEGATVTILTYGVPIWVEALRKSKNLTKYKRIQRLMNIKIAKAYRTVS